MISLPVFASVWMEKTIRQSQPQEHARKLSSWPPSLCMPKAGCEYVVLHPPQGVFDLLLLSRIPLGEFPKGAAELRRENELPHSSAGA